MRAAPALILLAATASPEPARACSVISYGDQPVITAMQESPDVSPVRIVGYEISRGCDDATRMGDCRHLGFVTLQLEVDGPLESLQGTRFEVVEGSAPMIGEGVLIPNYEGLVGFPWGDDDGQPPLDFSLIVQGVGDSTTAADGSAVTLVSAPEGPTQISHPGGGDCCSCLIAQRQSGWAALLLLIGAAYAIACGSRTTGRGGGGSRPR